MLFTKYLLHVSTLTAPSSGRTLITSQYHLLIVRWLKLLSFRAWNVSHVPFFKVVYIIKTMLGRYELKVFFNIKNLCLKLHNNLKCSWQDGGSTRLCFVSVSFLSTRPLLTLFLHCWLPFVSSYWLLSPCASGGLCYLFSLISRFSLFLVMFLFLKFLNHFKTPQGTRTGRLLEWTGLSGPC